MVLTQALGKSSWFSAEGTIIRDDATQSPDEHGGWELGTWFTGELTFVPESFKNRYVQDGDRMVNTREAGPNLEFRFTEEERQYALAELRKIPLCLPPASLSAGNPGYKIADASEYGNGEYWATEKWFPQLLKLFDDPNDLPVYYFC